MSDDDLSGETGTVDFDGYYDCYRWKRLEDMTEDELRIVRSWCEWNCHEADDLLEAWFDEQGVESDGFLARVEEDYRAWCGETE